VRNDEDEAGLVGDWKYVISTFYQLGFKPFVNNPELSLNRYLKSERRTTLPTGEWQLITYTIDRFGIDDPPPTFQYSPSQEAYELGVDNQVEDINNPFDRVFSIIDETHTQSVFRQRDPPHAFSGRIETETLSELNTIESCAEDCTRHLAGISLDDVEWKQFAYAQNAFGHVGPTGDPLGQGGGEILQYVPFGQGVGQNAAWFLGSENGTLFYTAIKIRGVAPAPLCVVTYRQAFLGLGNGYDPTEIVSCLNYNSDENVDGVLETVTIPAPAEEGNDTWTTIVYVREYGNDNDPDCCRQ